MSELKCKVCGNPIRLADKKISSSGQYEVSCGSIECMNLAFFEKKLDALDYANVLSGRSKGQR